MKRKRLEEVVKVMLEMTSSQMSDEDVSMIFINFMIHKEMVNHWPTVSGIMGECFVEYIVRASYESDEKYNVAIAVEDANEFLEGMVNGV